MVKGEVIEQLKKTQPLEVTPVTYSVEDIAEITNFFSILIKIDKNIKQKGASKNEAKNN